MGAVLLLLPVESQVEMEGVERLHQVDSSAEGVEPLHQVDSSVEEAE